MKKTFLLFFLIFGFSFATAQTNLDSLYTVWQDKTQADSIRANAYYDYIWDGVLFNKPDNAFILAEELLAFAQDKQLLKAQANAFNALGLSLRLRGKFSQALEYNKRGLKIKEQIGDKKGIAATLNNIGIIYINQGNYPQALSYYQRSLKIKEQIGDKKGIAYSLGNIGVLYRGQGNAPLALDYQKRSLKIKEEIGDKNGIALDLGNIGLIYNDQGKYAQALEYSLRSLKIREEIDDKGGITIALSNIGVSYFKQNKFPKAMDYLQRSLKINKEIGGKKGIAITLGIVGLTYIELGLYNEAITQCQRSLNLSKEIGSIDQQKYACSCLYEAYKGLGNGNKALAYHEQMLVLNDSLQSEETVKKLQQMEFAKQVLADSLLQVEKNLKIEMAHQTEVRKKDKNKNIALGAGIFFLLLSGGLYGRWRYVKKSKAIIEKEKARSENLLLNILPAEIAEELKLKGCADARDFDMVSILFTDFKGFTLAAEKLSAKELIEEINHCFMAFDHICEKHGIEKIKTIGDAYMAAGGLPIPSDDAVKNIVLAALDMQSFITNRIIEKQAKNEIPFKMRLGIHTGPVVAGIVGIKKFQYDIWGDTVNTASRMESSGEIGKVNISQETYKLIKNDPQFSFEARGKIQAKNKGEIEMLFVTKASY